MKNPTTIKITVCDNRGYNLDVYKRCSEYRGFSYQLACESFESLIDMLTRYLNLRNQYEVTIKKKEK